MQQTLYRGSFNKTLGYWFTTNIDTAKRYCHNAGYITTITIDINADEEGKYLLTRDLSVVGHHTTYGTWVRNSQDTWYYISPNYLNNNLINHTVVNLCDDELDNLV